MKYHFQKVIVIGASRGIGAAVAEHLTSFTNKLITVSRSPCSSGNWIQADISTNLGIEKVSNAVGNSSLDALLYMGATWETKAFTSEYSFENCSDSDLENVVAVNLLAPIRLLTTPHK